MSFFVFILFDQSLLLSLRRFQVGLEHFRVYDAAVHLYIYFFLWVPHGHDFAFFVQSHNPVIELRLRILFLADADENSVVNRFVLVALIVFFLVITFFFVLCISVIALFFGLAFLVLDLFVLILHFKFYVGRLQLGIVGSVRSLSEHLVDFFVDFLSFAFLFYSSFKGLCDFFNCLLDRTAHHARHHQCLVLFTPLSNLYHRVWCDPRIVGNLELGFDS